MHLGLEVKDDTADNVALLHALVGPINDVSK